MKTLKNLLQYDASKFIFCALILLLYIFSKQSYLAIILLILLGVYIFKKSKNLVIYSLILILIISVRISVLDNQTIELPLKGEIQEVFDSGFTLKEDGLVICYYDDIGSLEPGMIVEVKGYIVDTSTYNIMNTFDYEQYLKSKNIIGIISVDELTYLESSFNLYIFKHKINIYIEENYNEETASFLKLFILGEKDDLYTEKQETITDLGISHLFAISGMHLGLLVGLLSFLLKKLYISKSKNQVIIIWFIVIYNIITGFKISIMRASLLILGIFLKDYLKIYLTRIDLLSFSFIAFLLYNPYLLYNIGFQLSYLVAGSVIMGDYLFKDNTLFKRLTKVTVLASMISLPITLSINHSFGLVFIFANVFFILFVTYIFLPLSILVILIPYLSIAYSWVINIFNKALVLFDLINVIVDFNFSQLIYGLGFWVALLFFISNLDNKKRQLISLMSIILIFILSIFIPFKSNNFVRFLDVGQGDAIHIHSNQCNMLIDTGNTDKYDTLVSYFEAYNIKKLDYLVITHFHSDHYGEMIDLSSNLDVDNLYVNNYREELYNLEYEVLGEGYCFSCGSANFQVLIANTKSNNENNNSIVLYGEIGGEKYLFTGDIEKEVEDLIISKYQFEIDILKVPHHGSSTSSTTAFLDSINAKISVISVGADNSYGLPNSEILDYYIDRYYDIYRTDEDGTITFYYYNFFKLRLIEEYRKHNLPRYHLEYT